MKNVRHHFAVPRGNLAPPYGTGLAARLVSFRSSITQRNMNTKLLATTLVLAGFATAGTAQEGAETGAEELAVLPDFNAVDANEDGMIQATEAEPLAKLLEEDHNVEFRFEVVDENRDGQIDTAEYLSYDIMLAEQLGIA